MILLSFTARNHKSLRDEVALDLVRPTVKTLQPKDGDWAAATYPIAGIFGGNATGKSAVLSAFHYAFAAIRHSATTWQGDRTMRRSPFRLDGTHETASSMYIIEFVHDGRRHEYGFEVDREGVRREWLKDVPSLRWRTLVNRERAKDTLTTHSSLKALSDVTPRELVLSRAYLLDHPQLAPVARDLLSAFDIVFVKDSHREARLRALTEALAEGSVTFPDLESLLALADIGVTSVGIEEQEVPSSIRSALVRFQRELRAVNDADEGARSDESPEAATDTPGDELDQADIEAVARHLTFTHRGVTADVPKFSLHDESDGTIAWLALAVPALEALRGGGLLAVDEIDASLHPHLLDLLLGVFADPQSNPKHAQLIFTSHDAYILSPLSETSLEPEQVWFTDKSREGVTELFSLADFPRHPDANVARRYLTGRYGGTPRLSPADLVALIVAPSTDRETNG